LYNYITDSKSFNKKSNKIKRTRENYTTITANSRLIQNFFSQEQLTAAFFVGYQEITDYVKANGPGAYTVADIALLEAGSNNDSPVFQGDGQ
jgi:hypothetical protein